MKRRTKSKGWGSAAAVGALLLFSAGCHHRRVQPVLLPPQTPVALVPVPEPELPTLQATETRLPAVPMAQVAAKPKKVKRRSGSSSAKSAAAGVSSSTPAGGAKQVENTPPVTELHAGGQTPAQSEAIGALSVGGEGNPRAQQEAAELIGANERRLAAVSGDTAKVQAELLSKVRNFQKEARQALESGDAEGAKTLATKGKLLLDDLEAAGSR